ncbi:phosphotransferase family protein [Spirosoma taeanense]|uniref:Phosphotransferase family protein n=1 Tax=Spirosoma taeanense TaxID=2735870 RepID=A0A6M5YCJ9_9BACT|nr:phosphotransferase family protein [Spirosoma taeanense]QJW91795.1 phosphotransferase family protein [Spirosoma taeanense]
MNSQQDSPTVVRPGEELNKASLQAYLNDHVPNFGSITNIAQFPGGYSNLTYLLNTENREYVLRRPPFGAKDIKGGHDMGREFRVLTMLQNAGYRQVPEPVIFCDDESVMGCPFYVMARVPGVILRAQTAPELNIPVDVMRRLSEALVDNLVRLHALDIQQTGLIQLGKPEGYIRRQVEGWHKRYLTAQTNDVLAMTELARYLMDAMPPENPPTLLHNDFKYDNVVLNPDNLTEIRAVLDWEMCTVGDPLMDVGTSLSYWAEAGDNAFRHSFNLTHLPGNLTRQEFAHRYAEASGRDVSNLLYYYVFGLFKNAVVIQQIYGRYKKGLTQDPRFAGLLTGVQVLSAAGVKAVEANHI